MVPYRRALGALVVLCLFSGITPAAHAGDLIYSFNLPEESLVDTLRAIGRETTTNIVFAPETVEGARSPAIRGEFTLEQAVARALSKTKLQARQATANSILIETSMTTGSTSTKRRFVHGNGTADTDPPEAQAAQGALASARALRSGESAEGQPLLEEIVVTAQKKKERLQDVPVPVSVLNADNLADNNQDLLRDYYQTVPGLNVTPGGSDRQPLSIRGITTGGYTTPTVGVMIDDVPFGGSTTSGGIQIPDIDPGDLARIEVLRGPQGTLYGANSMGGVVKFVTKDPSTAGFSGNVEAGTSDVYNGAEPGFDFRASANVPVSDTFALRVSGFRRQDPGYIDNPVTGESGVNEAQAAGAHLAGLWRPSDEFSIKFAALYQDTKTYGSSEVDAVSGLGDWSQNYIRGAANGGDARTQLYSLVLKYKVGDLEFTSVTGYNEDRSSYSVDFSCCDGPTVAAVYDSHDIDGAPLTGYYDVRKFSQEFRLAGRLASQAEWLVGTFYTHESVPNVVNEPAEDPTTGQIVGPFFANSDPVTYEEYAAFGDLTYHFTDRFDVQIGGRESHTKNVFEESIQTGPAIEPFYGQPSPYITPAAEATANTFTYLLTPSFKLSPDWLLYARLASGYRPGIANTGLPLTAAVPRESDPDTTRNYEIGAKGEFLDHRLSLDASIYYIDWRNIQIALESPQFFSYESNGSRAKSEGVELSAMVRPWAGMSISGWISYDDAVLTEAFPSNSPAYGEPGNRLPNSMRYSGYISLEQDFPVGPEAIGFVGAQASYVGNRLGIFEGFVADTDEAKPRQYFPAYTKTDLRLGVRDGLWTTNLYVNNVGNVRGLIGGGIGYFPSDAFVYITPRTYGLNISRSF